MVTLVAAIQFLRLRAWARTYLEALCWFGLAYTIGFGIWFAITWVSTVSRFEVTEPNAPPLEFIAGFGLVMSVLVSLFLVIPLAIMIWLLRMKIARIAMSSTTAANRLEVTTDHGLGLKGE